MEQINNILLRNYKESFKNDILIIIPFFNPVNSVRITNNLLFVKNKLDYAKLPYIIYHCLFPNSHKILPESDTYQIIESNSYAFYKENLAGIIIKKNIEKYKKFIILDCDIIFDHVNWYDIISDKLESYEFVHPFEKMYYINYNFKINKDPCKITRYIKQNDIRLKNKNLKLTPGFIIAFTKDFFEKNIIPEECLLGGGDTHLYNLISNTRINIKEYYCIKKNITNPINYDYVDLTIYHLYHNEIVNRQYISRMDILNNYLKPNKNIYDLIEKDSNGLYQWKENIREQINKDILKYFENRKDDEITL